MDRVLDALGDRTRRAVLVVLRTGPKSVAEIAGELPVTRPAVSQHLRVLAEAGLVTHERVGTRHEYRVAEAGLAALRAWLELFWDDVLGRYARHAERGDR